jgi:hypothetical protein
MLESDISEHSARIQLGASLTRSETQLRGSVELDCCETQSRLGRRNGRREARISINTRKSNGTAKNLLESMLGSALAGMNDKVLRKNPENAMTPLVLGSVRRML